MSNIDKRELREAAEKALPAMQRLLMMPNDELFDEALLNVDGDVDAANAFNLLTGPETVMALLDELEAAEHTAVVDHEAARSLVEENKELKRKLEAAERERDNWRTSFDNERFRADKLAEAFKTEHEQLLMANSALITQHMRANGAESRIAELDGRDKSRMMDALHVAVALNSAGISLNDFDECVLRLHEWGALPDYCIALYVDFIHGYVSENKLLDFGYVNDNGAFAFRQAEKRIAELQIARDKCFMSGLKTGLEYGIADDTEGYNREIDDAQTVIDRAAMLQAEPVSNSDELPLDYLQGHKDGLEWAAQLAEANHPQTGDWLYDDPIELARAIRKGHDMPEFKSASVDEDDNFYSWFGRFWYENYQQNNYTTSAKQMLGTMAEFAFRAGRESATQAGNSPVIQDGYVMVPKELTCEMDDAAWDAYHETRSMSDIWAALLSAAPQQGVK